MRFRYIIVLSIIISFGLSFMNNKEDALGSLFFRLGLDAKKDKAAIEASIHDYNTYSAGLYSSGGHLAGLDYIPAVPLLKRRLFKDIELLGRNGLILVFDLDSQHVRKVYFMNGDFAVAETEEVWAVDLQYENTRKPIYNVKAVVVGARYQFVRKDGKWIASAVDVYPKGEKIPAVRMQFAL